MTCCTVKVVQVGRHVITVKKAPPTFIVRFVPGVIQLGGGGGGSFDPDSLPLTTEIQPQELIGKFTGAWKRQRWDDFSKNTINCGTF